MPPLLMADRDDANSTVTVCHRHTRDLTFHTKRADILIVATGRAGLVTGDMIRAGAVVIDFTGAPIATADDLMSRIAATPPGSRAYVTVSRGGRTQALQVDVDRLPLESRRAAPVEEPTDFGLTIRDITRPVGFASAGAMVMDVRDGSAAARAGIETGDVVLKVNRRTVHAANDAMRELQRLPIGTRIAFVLISREGDELLVELPRD